MKKSRGLKAPSTEQREAQREAMKEAMAAVVPGTAVSSIIESLQKNQKYLKLFQDNPDDICTFTMKGTKTTKKTKKNFKNRSHSNSYASQQNHARREFEILTRNGRIPTKQITLRLQTPFKTKKEMTDLLTRLFRYLERHGIIAAVALEGTKDKFGRPTDRLHCHVLIDDKDAPRSKKELIALFEKACRLRGYIRGENIKIGYEEFRENFTFDYFVKLGEHGKNIPMFLRKLRIHKFRYIGEWFYTPKTDISDEYSKEMEKIFSTDNTAGTKKPTKKKE